MANEYQEIFLDKYPGVDMLPIDATDPNAVDEAVRSEDIGDTLFECLWRELENADSPSAARQLVAGARKDIEPVRAAMLDAGPSDDPHRILLASYPQIDLLPIDTENAESVAKAVADNNTGDTLFNFLWRELADAGNPEAACEMLEKAIGDIEAVEHGFAQPQIKLG